MTTPTKNLALVLTGGGARSAYQAGALLAISEILNYKKNPFNIISGYSAGALNGTWLASQNDDFKTTAQKLVDLWSNLSVHKVFNVSAFSLGKIAYKWLFDRGFGGLHYSKNQITYLLDTTPLAHFVHEHINFSQLNQNVENQHFRAISLSATNYHTGDSVAFYNGHKNIKDWHKLNRLSYRTPLTAKHVLASCALPVFFPPVKINESYYGDGIIRLHSPLSSAIHLGAHKILAIGNRRPLQNLKNHLKQTNHVSLGDIIGTILNGLFFDSLEADLDRIERINQSLLAIKNFTHQQSFDKLRLIPTMCLMPQSEPEQDPNCDFQHLPKTLTYLLGGIGVNKDRGAELLHYLAFEPSYLQSLIQIGYNDTLFRKNDIIDFID